MQFRFPAEPKDADLPELVALARAAQFGAERPGEFDAGFAVGRGRRGPSQAFRQLGFGIWLGGASSARVSRSEAIGSGARSGVPPIGARDLGRQGANWVAEGRELRGESEKREREGRPARQADSI